MESCWLWFPRRNEWFWWFIITVGLKCYSPKKLNPAKSTKARASAREPSPHHSSRYLKTVSPVSVSSFAMIYWNVRRFPSLQNLRSSWAPLKRGLKVNLSCVWISARRMRWYLTKIVWIVRLSFPTKKQSVRGWSKILCLNIWLFGSTSSI